MYYRIIDKEIVPAETALFSTPEQGVGFLTLAEAENRREELGIDDYELELCRRHTRHLHAGIETRGDRSIILINAINRGNTDEFDRIAFLLRRNKLLLVQIEDADDSAKLGFEDVIKRRAGDAAYEAVVYDLFAQFLASGEDLLDGTEEEIAAMEEDVADGRFGKTVNQRICTLRNSMSRVMRYYEELVDVGEALQADDGNIFDASCKRFFRRFTDKAYRLGGTARLLSENLVHVREALSASLDNSMNLTMKVFTVVSVVFMPLTLIVGWYGMNFINMPELSWKFGYPAVAILCVAVVIACVFYFRKKKYF